MLQQNCAGGIVFFKRQVLLTQNEKYEWSFPKGRIRSTRTPEQTAIDFVLSDTGVHADILHMAGTTSYEFYSIGRQCPVRNHVIWYTMLTHSNETDPADLHGIVRAMFFDFEEAIKQVTYSQDKSILMMAWQQFTE
ncbi:MAG TPA: NUDIX domain-containing protein [Clostridiaceae bacterium]|nr:NUDIX domain-containing protein [Clostridiaceae bacterium]